MVAWDDCGVMDPTEVGSQYAHVFFVPLMRRYSSLT